VPALGIIPLIGAVGAAVDYSWANSMRSAMQDALDSAALMLSRDAQTLSTEQLASWPEGKRLFLRRWPGRR
jgi:Flp pilus assembly protein TadG